MNKWPDKIPIVLEKSSKAKIKDFPKHKFLCPREYSVRQFLGSLRRRASIGRDKALFLFINGTELATGDATMASIYEHKKDEDGFLYILLSDQEVMGSCK